MEVLFRTNSLTKLYHNQYGSFYLGRNIDLRVDHILCLSTKVIIVNYYSFQKAKLTTVEEMKGLKAYELISGSFASCLGNKLGSKYYNIQLIMFLN